MFATHPGGTPWVTPRWGYLTYVTRELGLSFTKLISSAWVSRTSLNVGVSSWCFRTPLFNPISESSPTQQSQTSLRVRRANNNSPVLYVYRVKSYNDNYRCHAWYITCHLYTIWCYHGYYVTVFMFVCIILINPVDDPPATYSGGTLWANPLRWYRALSAIPPRWYYVSKPTPVVLYQQTHSGGILYQQTHSSGALSANPLWWDLQTLRRLSIGRLAIRIQTKH